MKFDHNRLWILPLFAVVITSWVSCNKTSTTASGPYKLSYGDSIIYLKQLNSDYIVYPVEYREGTYFGFPEGSDGIRIDESTGAINVTKSESGLRYRITHLSPTGETTTTYVVISGINFTDHFYRLSLGDSIANPVYNADVSSILPLTGSIFDEGNNANSGGCSIKTTDGKINLAQTVRNGTFGTTPSNNDRKEFDIIYRLNDNSGKAENKIRVKLYYYNTMADVAPDLLETLQERTSQGVFVQAHNGNPFYIDNTSARPGTILQSTAVAKPRPPCVIIVAQ